MLNKNKRLEAITKIIEEKGTVRVSEIVTSLNVSDMTVRRDFTELEENERLYSKLYCEK